MLVWIKKYQTELLLLALAIVVLSVQDHALLKGIAR